MLCQELGFTLSLPLMSALLELTQRLKALNNLTATDVAVATRELSSAQTVDAEKIDFFVSLGGQGHDCRGNHRVREGISSLVD